MNSNEVNESCIEQGNQLNEVTENKRLRRDIDSIIQQVKSLTK